jgi:hypothetical protein
MIGTNQIESNKSRLSDWDGPALVIDATLSNLSKPPAAQGMKKNKQACRIADQNSSLHNVRTLCFHFYPSAILDSLGAREAFWRKRRRITLAARCINQPEIIRHPLHKGFLLHK